MQEWYILGVGAGQEVLFRDVSIVQGCPGSTLV